MPASQPTPREGVELARAQIPTRTIQARRRKFDEAPAKDQHQIQSRMDRREIDLLVEGESKKPSS